MINLLGHDAELAYLQEIDPHKAQTLLFEGREGVGKRQAALILAARILQVSNFETLQAHPDFFFLGKSVDLKTGKEKAEISAEDARKLAKFMALTPAQSDFRVAIIDSADRLNPTAANAILKIVEEPPRAAVIILLSHLGGILPTIRSRCQRIYFRDLSAANVTQVLGVTLPNLTLDERQILIEIAEGAPGLAMEIHENGGLEIGMDLFAILANPQTATYQRLAKFAETATKATRGWAVFRQLLDWLLAKTARAGLAGLPVQIGAQQIKAKDALHIANLAEAFAKQIEQAEIYNMDKKALIIQLVSSFLRVPTLQPQ